MSSIRERESTLIQEYVGCFEKLGDMTACDTDPVASQLAVGEDDQYGFKHWRPAKVDTDAKHSNLCIQNSPHGSPLSLSA